MAGLAGPRHALVEVEAALRSGLGALPADDTGLAVGFVGMVTVDAEEASELSAELGRRREDPPVDLQEGRWMGGRRDRSRRPVAGSRWARRRGQSISRGGRLRCGWWRWG
jgi:hypothetical protein